VAGAPSRIAPPLNAGTSLRPTGFNKSASSASRARSTTCGTVITELAELGVADHVLESISGHLRPW
jgi:hypothetical protein